MTEQDNARIARLETSMESMKEDITEIKAVLVSQNLQARIAVLEERTSKLEKLLWSTAGVGGVALGGHVPTFLNLVGSTTG